MAQELSGPVVFVVDDDVAVQRLIRRMLELSGYRVQGFVSAEEFLNAHVSSGVGCLVIDLRLPGLNGLELQQALSQAGRLFPIVFITGYGDIPTSVKAMKAGAVDFLAKPFTEEALLNAVRHALDRSRKEGAVKNELLKIQKLLATLTAREAEVLPYIVAGWLNKQIAAELGIAEQTVKIHRGRIMKKLQARSLAELVQLALKAELPLPPASS
jgi:FixJ family two-component response regulator